MKKDKTNIIKLVMLIVFIFIMIFLTIQLFPIFKSISTEEGRMNFKQDMEGLGSKGIFAIIGLMVVQIFLPILPRRTSRDFSRNVISEQLVEC
ncbi:MAG: hypothetical protein HFJ51_02055 [Clostridia bacterium]|nr:hypothetical protein [Clostridia bacterium]